MAKLVNFKTGDREILIAVRTPDDAISPVGVLDDAIDKAEKSLDTVLSVVSDISDSLHGALSKSKYPPTSAEVGFGLDFTAKGNIYVVETEAKASISVKLTYSSLA